MTRQELIQIIERKISEQEFELRVDRQALAVLRGKQGGGPIVYGNGHHDGKKPHSDRDEAKNRTDSLTGIVKKALLSYPDGLTTAQMRDIAIKAGFPLRKDDTNPIHNAMRHIPGISRSNSNPRSNPKIYTLKGVI